AERQTQSHPLRLRSLRETPPSYFQARQPTHRDDQLSAAYSLTGGGGRFGDALELDIKRAVVSLDATTDRNVSLVVSDPHRKLTLLVVDETIRPKQFRLNVKHLNATKNRL